MSSERRLNQRLKVYVPVRVSRPGSPVVETLAKDIGVGGLRCLSPSVTPVGSEMALEISLPGSPDVAFVRGRTVWFRVLPDSGQFDLGIVFVEVSERTQRLLSTYCEHCSALTPA